MSFYDDEMKKYGRKPDSRFSGHSPGYKERKEEEGSLEEELGLEEPIEDNVFEETYTRTKTSEKVVEEEAAREVKPENKKNKDERELHECILAAYKNGIKNKSEIARKCKCSRQTVYRIAEKVWY